LADCWLKDKKRVTWQCKFIALTVCAVYSNSRIFWVAPLMYEIFQTVKYHEVASTHSYWGVALYLWCMWETIQSVKSLEVAPKHSYWGAAFYMWFM